MKTLTSLVCTVALLLFACNRTDVPVLPDDPRNPRDPFIVDHYEDDFDSVENRLYKNGYFRGVSWPAFFQATRYRYYYPCFNPHNPYQFVYIRSEPELMFGCNHELVTFNFESGASRVLVTNACRDVYWTTDNWIWYLGSNNAYWRVRPNGDDLRFVGATTDWVVRYPTVHPSGDSLMYYSNESRALRWLRKDGTMGPTKIAKYIEPYGHGWLDSTRFMGQWTYPDRTFRDVVIYDTEADSIVKMLGEDQKIRASGAFVIPEREIAIPLPGSWWTWIDVKRQRIDTIRRMYDSYSYGAGTYAPRTDRMLVILGQTDWKDSLRNEVYRWSHIMMLDGEGNELGTVRLPE